MSRKRNSQITKIFVILLSQNGILCVQIRIKDICEETGIKVDFKSTKAGFVQFSTDLKILMRPLKLVKIQSQGGQSSGQSGRESSREPTSHSIDQQILKLCSKEDLSFAEIISKLGYSHNNPYVHNRIVALRKLGLLEYTIPEKTNSRLQKYRLVKK